MQSATGNPKKKARQAPKITSNLEASSQISERSKASKSEWEMTKNNRDKNPKSLIRANVNGKKIVAKTLFVQMHLKREGKCRKFAAPKRKKRGRKRPV